MTHLRPLFPLLLLGAATGCRGLEASAPRILAVNPNVVVSDGSTPVPLQISGENLTPLTLADGVGMPSLRLPTLVLVSATDSGVVPLNDVNWLNDQTMSAVLPAGIAIDAYAIRATNPGGESTQSPALLDVQSAVVQSATTGGTTTGGITTGGFTTGGTTTGGTTTGGTTTGGTTTGGTTTGGTTTGGTTTGGTTTGGTTTGGTNVVPQVQAVSPSNLCLAASTALQISGQNLLLDGNQTPQILVLSGQTPIATGANTQMTGCAAGPNNVQICTGISTTLQMNTNNVLANTYSLQVTNPTAGDLSVSVPLNLTLAPIATTPAANGTVHLCTGGGGNFEIQGSSLESMTAVMLGGVAPELVQGIGCTGGSCPTLRATFGANATAQTGNVPLSLSNGGVCSQTIATNVVVAPGFTITSVTPSHVSEAADAALVVQLDSMAGADVVNTIALVGSNGVPVYVCGTANTSACAALLPISTDVTGNTVAVTVPAAVLQSFVSASGPPPTVGIEVQLQQSGCGAFLANALMIQK